MPIIKAENISMSYEGKKVLEDVSFDVEKGDYLCIVGENGSGKTTLLKALTGLKRIDSGILSFADGFSRTQIGYLPQMHDFQRDFPASVKELVLSGCINSMGLKPFYTKKEKKKAEQAMEMLEIMSLSDKCYHELSGGQQQKVLLARALCASGSLIIMDEPTTGLDYEATAEFYELIERLNRNNMTIIMILHDIQKATSYANKILHLGESGSLFFGSCEEYKTRGWLK